MNMHHDELGDYQMHNEVVEYEAGRCWCGSRPGWKSRPGRAGSHRRSAWYRWGFEFVPDGPGATMVTETFDCSRSPEELREAVREGEGWRDAMTASLVKLELLAKAVGPA